MVAVMRTRCPLCGLMQDMETIRCVRCHTLLLPKCEGACTACKMRKLCTEKEKTTEHRDSEERHRRAAT